MGVTLDTMKAQLFAKQVGLSDQAAARLAQNAAPTIDDVRQLAVEEGLVAQFEQALPSLADVTQGPQNATQVETQGAPIRGVFASLLADKSDKGAAFEKLLGKVVENFDKLAYVKSNTDLFGIEDVNHILGAPKGTFTNDVVMLAKEIAAHPDLLSLADWTHPDPGLHTHDRTNVKEEYGRALTLVQNRHEISRAMDHLLKNFETISRNGGHPGGALERSDIEAEIGKVGKDSPLGRTLALALNGGLTPWPAPTDLVGVLANASGNTGPSQMITREGIKALKTLVNGGDLSVRDRSDNYDTDRTDLVNRVIQHFDALKLGETYLGPHQLDAIVANPEAHAPEVVEVARDLKRNGDLLSLADHISNVDFAGQGTNDRLTEKLQYEKINELFTQRKTLTAAIDHVIDNYATLQAKSGITTLTPDVLRAEIERLKGGNADEQWIAQQLSTVIFDNYYGGKLDFVGLLTINSGNNDPNALRAISYESLHRLRNTLNSPQRTDGTREVHHKLDGFGDGSGVQLNGSAKMVGWLDYKTSQSQGSPTENRTKVRLTDELHQAGSVFMKDALPLGDADTGRRTSFSTQFTFQMHGNHGIGDADGNGADGITFAIASDPKTLGWGGGSLGIQGSPSKSVVVEFDTYQNGRADALEPTGNHIAIKLNGANDSVVAVPVPGRFNDGMVWSAWVDYDAERNTLEVRLQRGEPAKPFVKPEAPVLAYKIDIAGVVGNQAHLGFTGATGDGGANQDVFGLDVKARIPVPAEE